MKLVRLLLGIVIVFAALWVVVGEQMSGASADATLNAPVVTLRAETAGVLTLPDRSLGSRITRGEIIAEVEDRLVDRLRSDDLEMEAAFAAAGTARTGTTLGELRALLDSLETRGATYGEERLADLRVRRDHARARLDMLEGPEGAALDEAEDLLETVDQDGGRLPGEPRRLDLVIDHARERLELLEIALRAAEAGVWLGDGYNDAPVSEQKAYELRAEIARLEAQFAEQETREAAIAARLSRERVRVNTLTGGGIAAPVTGLYWEELQADGVSVQRGDPILRLVDCERTLVTVSVTERVYNDLTVGEAATVRLSGAERAWPGTVVRLAGPGAATIYNHLAIAPSQKHLERFDVAIEVPDLTADAELGCAIGRTGRAFFDRRPLDWLRR